MSTQEWAPRFWQLAKLSQITNISLTVWITSKRTKYWNINCWVVLSLLTFAFWMKGKLRMFALLDTHLLSHWGKKLYTSKHIFQEVRDVFKFQSGNASMTETSSQLLASCFFPEIKVFKG